MKKRYLCVAAMICGCILGCESNDSGVTEVKSCNKDCSLQSGEFPEDSGMFVCAVVNGHESCVTPCLGKNEGKNAPVCRNMHPSQYVFSVTDTCAKDDLGTLYQVSSDSEVCVNGCNEADGTCKTSGEELKCDHDCETIGGGRGQKCMLVSGKPVCQTPCHGTKEGENEPFCYQNASTGPDSPFYSVKDTCAKDDNGKLYVLTSAQKKCDFECSEETGLCLKPSTD